MRTTIDIPDPLMKRAKIQAALEGKKLREIVTEALLEHLSDAPRTKQAKVALPSNVSILQIGRFKIPQITSNKTGRVTISPEDLNALELNEDQTRYGKDS